MSRLKSLLQEALDWKKQGAEFDNKIASLRANLSTLESQTINLAELDLSDEAAVLALSSRELRLKALPEQIVATDRKKGDAMRALAATADLIKRELNVLARGEQEKTVTEVATAIKPYFGASAENVAWQAPIALSIGGSVVIKGVPRDEGNTRREESEMVSASFDYDTLSFADEVIAVADRYIERGTFISEIYSQKKR